MPADIGTSMRSSGRPLLFEGHDLTKAYSGTTVLSGVHLAIHEGEVHAVIGENGAGKSTLMKIIAGLIPHGQFTGTMTLQGRTLNFSSLREGEDAGIIMVPQELHVIPQLSLAENMYAARLPGRMGWYDEREAVKLARAALKEFGLEFDPRAPAGWLTPSERRLTVLAAALQRSAKLLILDEPTAAMTAAETALLMQHLRVFRDAGCGILYITHRLDEVSQLADSVLVLRNGNAVARFDAVPTGDLLVSAMLGETRGALAKMTEENRGPIGSQTPILQVRGLTAMAPGNRGRTRVMDVSFDLRPGEVLGLYGLVGAGRTELARAIFGTWTGKVSGECTIGGVAGIPKSPEESVRRGMVLLAEDRKTQGVFAGQTVAWNTSVTMLNSLSRFGLIDSAQERSRVARLMEEFRVRPNRPDIHIESLSGGNQQKVLLGRCMIDGLRVLMLDEPTLGVDVGARQEIYRMIRRIAREQNVGVLLISSDLTEIEAEADRVLVMYKGRIQREVPRGVASEVLLAAATGVTK